MSATERTPNASIVGRAFVWLQYLLPQHGLSRLVLKATRVRNAAFKNALIKGFLKLYRVNMTDAAQSDPLRYGSFNEFFTRALKSGVRPPPPDTQAIACPVDGTVSECGTIQGVSLLQAKGQRYTLLQLLGGEPWAAQFESGIFATIYLAPYNYHRIHMPAAGTLRGTWFVPGRLFSVNQVTARHVPRLFARNERVITLWDSPLGPMAVVLVGALNVGSMSTVWAEDIAPSPHRRVTRLADRPVSLERGEELGRFNMGSTVVLLFCKDRARWDEGLRGGARVRLNQAIGSRV